MERVADYVIRKVNKAGAGHIFMVTGRGILYLTDAVARNQEIEAVSTYHEQGASYAAMSYAAVGNKISACLVSTGCAATNAVTAALCAYQDNLPVVFISGNNMLNETTRFTGVPIRTYGSQEADIIEIVKSVTKYAVMLTDSSKVVYEVEKALYIAMEGRKGPVWIDIPLDIQNMRINEGMQEHFILQNSYSQISETDVKEIADELNAAQRPVILIGGGIASAGAENELIKLIEQKCFPLVFSPTASDVYGTVHELSIGTVGSLGGSRVGNFVVQNSDLVLAIGTKLCSQETGVKENFAREAKIIVVDIDKKEHTKKGIQIDKIIHADAKDFLKALLNENVENVKDSWVEKCQHWKQIFSIRNEEFIKELKRKDEMDIYSLADMLSDWLPEDATIITDAGFEELIVPSAIRYKHGQKCLFPAAQGAMGYAIPAILGAYYAGRKNIVCIVGDGSFMMNMQELQIIVAKRIPVKIIVVNNNMYAVIRKRQTDLFRKRTIGNDPSDGVPAPGFENIAACFGFDYNRIDTLSELYKSMKKMFLSDDNTGIYEVLCTSEQKYFHESYALNEKKRLIRRPIEDMSPFLDRELLRKEMIIKMLEE